MIAAQLPKAAVEMQFAGSRAFDHRGKIPSCAARKMRLGLRRDDGEDHHGHSAGTNGNAFYYTSKLQNSVSALHFRGLRVPEWPALRPPGAYRRARRTPRYAS